MQVYVYNQKNEIRRIVGGMEMWKSHIPEGKSGKWVVERFTVSEAGSAFSGFKDVRRQVPPGDYTRLVCTSGCGDTVMSDTISEYRDHRKFIGISSGRVLIAGLGLGLVLTAVAEKEEVTEITIIENSEDVVKLTWPHMSEKVKSKTTLIVGDIYNSSLIKRAISTTMHGLTSGLLYAEIIRRTLDC
jgi:hypothetical protein